MNLRDALQTIYERHGKLTPEIVVAEAKANQSGPGKFLHDKFEWDDRKAGEKWRQTQASELIRSARVVYREATEDEEARSVRAFHAIRHPEGNSYEPVADIAGDELSKKILLRDMERDWKALKRRYEHMREFFSMVQDDLDKVA